MVGEKASMMYLSLSVAILSKNPVLTSIQTLLKSANSLRKREREEGKIVENPSNYVHNVTMVTL